MADRIRSVDFLPEIFQTTTNKKFLSSTLDQLIQEPKLKVTQGYIGRKSAPGKTAEDGYVIEPTDVRTNYQLEPGIVFADKNGNTLDALTYTGLIDGLSTAGAEVSNHDRLFRSEAYSWNPFIDFDKFVNYSQYFWLPNGPDNVTITADSVYTTDTFDITRNDNSYEFNGFSVLTPVLTVVRGQTYTFNVDQDDHNFYIQTQPGVDGVMPWASNVSSREVLGVTNNGADVGTITFEVPLSTAQDFYHTLADAGNVDFATEATFAQINNQLLSTVAPIIGLQDLDLKTIVFLDDTLGQVFQLTLLYSNPADPTVVLTLLSIINNLEKFQIQYGAEFANVSFYRTDPGGLFSRVPLSTASLDTLYYQDATNPELIGIINVVDLNESAVLQIDSILGQEQYTSPNGVTLTNGMKVTFTEAVNPADYTANEYYVEGVGRSIRLVNSSDLVIPETYTVSASVPWDIGPWDVGGLDGTLNAPLHPDYLTINRSSIDKNAWSRSNRWFHIDVIQKTADYNDTVANLNNTNRANRPIIEFDSDLRLYKYGTYGKRSVDIIDFTTEDALSTINGEIVALTSVLIDGYQLIDNTRIIFAGDTDSTVRNKIFVVNIEIIDPVDGPVYSIAPAEDSDTFIDDVVVVSSGITLQGQSYRYNGVNWVESQQKQSINQAPLFDIFDVEGSTFGNPVTYPSTNFEGTKLFSYAEGTGVDDAVLGFPLKFLNIDNLGDIVFDNNLYNDTFNYVINSVTENDTPVHNGFVRKYSSRDQYVNEIGWVPFIEEAYSAQILQIGYNGTDIVLDVLPKTDLLVPSVNLLVDNVFVNAKDYTVTGKVITLHNQVPKGTDIEVKVISDELSKIGYYEVPSNLSRNIFNENTTLLTLGTVRNHFNELAKNVLDIEGVINGSNNLRDLGDISKYGNVIVQQSAPLALSGMFLRNKEYNFFNAVTFNARHYEKLKNQVTDWVNKNDIFGMSANQMLDAALNDLNTNKSIESTFHHTDMLPSGIDFETTDHIITVVSTDTFSTIRSYDFTQANSSALLVYHNDSLLIKDIDYTVADDGPRITLLFEPVLEDVIRITEYDSTAGSNIPNTPTKLGLYPKFVPMLYADNTYVKTVDVIRGHDGSITVAAGDASDEVLLEFEKRIYNNIKVNTSIPLDIADVTPGQFRDTDYTSDEIVEITSPSLLSWLGWNRIDFKTQDYVQAEEKTWNYSSCGNKLDDNSPLRGNWRAIYNYFYDTDAPHERPWEMLGLTERPSWWILRYGPAPYTRGNLVLWDDLEAGLLTEPGNERVLDKFKRPGLTTILPVDDEGNLLMPLHSVVGGYDTYNFKQAWATGDQGPAESAWRKSSAWPFAVQQILALTKPAQYFSLMADRDRYAFNTEHNQYLYDGRLRLDSRTIEVPSNTVLKHGYINWIVDYNRHFGFNSTDKLVDGLANMDVSLCHHMASFTDSNSLKIFTDKSSPDSTNNSLLLPDESYDLLMYKNQAFDEIIYSSVIVQKLERGYSVFGNSITDPFFKAYNKLPNSKTTTVTVNGSDVHIPTDFSTEATYIPYGYVFSTYHAVVNFLVGYGEYLKAQGLRFSSVEGTHEINWQEMAKEFVYWTNQGWGPGSVINLNPAASVLEFERDFSIVDSLNDLALTEQPLDQDGVPFNDNDFVIDRLDNNFKITVLNGNAVGYLKFKLTSFEHLLVLDNTSIFNDLIYNPVTGIRQHRVKLSGFTTSEWNGQLDAQGFMYNEDNVVEWTQAGAYNKGDIVKFKNAYWSASSKVQPSEEFNFNLWIKTDYNSITKGLLSNLATKSDQMLSFYNNKTANLETDADLFSLGLTGFRPRDYLQSLDLDDISQVNIYSGMIQQKGTLDSLNLFQDVTLNKETIDYEIFENWAVKRAEFGASSNRSFIDLQLEEKDHTSNPTLIEITNDVDATGDQIIAVDHIFKQSEKNNTEEILPLLIEKNLDTSLPTAGFVTANEVDIVTFDLASLDQDAVIEDDTLIWVADDANLGWNVYRTNELTQELIAAIDNLDGTATLNFDIDHNLTNNDIITIKEFDDQIDGTHSIVVKSPTTIDIEASLNVNQTAIEDGTGRVFKFISARIEVPSDIAGSVHDNNINSTDKVWVNSSNGNALTLEKGAHFKEVDALQNIAATTGERFGCAVSQGQNTAGLIVSNPEFASTGVVYCYDKIGPGYFISQTLTLGGQPIANYGTSLSFVENNALAGAPSDGIVPAITSVIRRNKHAGTFTEIQIIVPPALPVAPFTDFGSSVVLSDDEDWAYISEPSVNNVHAYQKVNYQKQQILDVVDNITIFDSVIVPDATTGLDVIVPLTDLLKAGNENEIVVLLDSVLLTPVTDYTYDGTEITFTPAISGSLEVTRLAGNVFPGTGTEINFSITNLYALDGIESFTVRVDGVLQRPGYDYTFVAGVPSEGVVTFINAPLNSTFVTVDLNTYFKYIHTINSIAYGIDTGGFKFGADAATNIDGSHVAITTPSATVEGLVEAGNTHVLERVVERFVVVDTGIFEYTSIREPISVLVNSVRLIEDTFNVGSNYTQAGNTITLHDISLVVGDFVDIITLTPGAIKFNLLQTLTQGARANRGATFGNAVSVSNTKSAIYVAAKNDSYNAEEAGSVTRFVNTAIGNNVIVSTNPSTPSVPLTLTLTDTIRITNIEIAVGNNLTELKDIINNSLIPNVVATINTNAAEESYLTIELINKEVTSLANKLEVTPGSGTAYSDLGFVMYTNSQVIEEPGINPGAHFGSALQVDFAIAQLIISATNALTADSTYTVDSSVPIAVNGKVYTYDVMEDATKNTEGKLVFGQRIWDSEKTSAFGDSISLRDGILVVGSPNYNTVETDQAGRVVVFENTEQKASWSPIKVENKPVDFSLINSIYIYDNESFKVKQYLDYIDPLNGKILGAAQQNIDFIGEYEPTIYETGRNGLLWGKAQLDMIWWNTSTARFVDYNLSNIKEASQIWGTLFPGSSVDVYQWIESTELPEAYTGNGTVHDTTKFVTLSDKSISGEVQNSYYYWVKGLTSISVNSQKTLSVDAIASYIESPISSGIAYAALVAPNVIGLYNCNNLIDNTDSILHIEYDKIKNDSNVFVEYDLIRENYANDFMSTNLYKKFQDSLIGADSLGNVVPDESLAFSDKFGIDFRPRKSMFVDRYAALASYLGRVNTLLKEYTIVESRDYPLLYSEEEIPEATEWDEQVFDAEELSFQDISLKPVGYKYLVETDANQDGLWTIHEVAEPFPSVKVLQLGRVQTYDTKRFWNTIDWYSADYNLLTLIDVAVDSVTELSTLTVPINTISKVNSNSVNKWEIHRLTESGWERVGLQDGTIEFKEILWNYALGRFGWDSEVFDGLSFSEEPLIELRQIIKSVNEELLIKDLAVERNKAFMSVFNYILAEQPNVDWLYKTSLIDVNHRVRSLSQYAVYQKDKQDYLVDYIKETKPYHTKIKDFLLSYNGMDTFAGAVTDFDCPSVYNAEYGQFISPILDDGANLITDPSNTLATDPLWQQSPWDQWIANYRLDFQEVVVTKGGSGYTVPPTVTVTGTSLTPAVLTASITAGEVTSIEVIDAGSGWTETPIITITGDGSDAKAIAITGNDLVRTFTTTIKYDRFQYQTKVTAWTTNNNYVTKNLFVRDGYIYRVTELNNDTVFDPAKYELLAHESGHLLTADSGILTADATDITVDFATPVITDTERLYIKEGLPTWEENDNSVSKNYIRFGDKVYLVTTFNTDSEFIPGNYTLIDVGTLSGIDRTSGFYVSNTEDPGLDLSLLIDGIVYPGVEVFGSAFDDNSVLDTTYESIFPGITEGGLAPAGTPYSLANYSDSLNTYNGTRPSDIDIDGGEFIDTYHSHAPEELVPGSIFDTLDMKVFSRPGGDYLSDGHAFRVDSRAYTASGSTIAVTFNGISRYAIELIVSNTTTGATLYEGIDYTLDWVTETVLITQGITLGDKVAVFVYEVGGGLQLHRGNVTGIDLVANATEIPVELSEIYNSLVFVNGVLITGYTITSINAQTSLVTFTISVASSDVISITVFGTEAPQHEHSYPVTQTFTATPYTLGTGAVSTKNKYNAIVEVNGLRLRSPGAHRHIADGIETLFTLPDIADITQDSIPDNQIEVYVKEDLLVQGIDYTVTAAFGLVDTADILNTGSEYTITTVGTTDFTLAGASANIVGTVFIATNSTTGTGTATLTDALNRARSVDLTAPPEEDDTVDIIVMELAEYTFSGDTLNLVTPVGVNRVAVTTFKDVSQLDMLTQVFAGPTVIGEPGTESFINEFIIDRLAVTNLDRLWVTLNGRRLLGGSDYIIIIDNVLELTMPTIEISDILIVTTITDSIVTNGVHFRLFKDMRGTTAMYSLNASSTTYLLQDVVPEDDIIYVRDATVLGEPDLAVAKFGILTINGERITYRERDLINNTVSGLRRGTAGTAIAELHTTNTNVYDISAKSLVNWDYDQIWYDEQNNGVPLSDQHTIPALFIKN